MNILKYTQQSVLIIWVTLSHWSRSTLINSISLKEDISPCSLQIYLRISMDKVAYLTGWSRDLPTTKLSVFSLTSELRPFEGTSPSALALFACLYG